MITTKTRRILRFALLGLLAFIGLLPRTSFAHPANVPSADVKVDASGGVTIRVHLDLLAYALDATPAEIPDMPMNSLLDGPPAELQARLNEAQHRFAGQMLIFGDGERAAIKQVTFPTAEQVLAWAKAAGKQRLPVMMNITASTHLPPATRTLSVKFPEVMDTVVLTTECAYQEPQSEPVEAGNTSSAIALPEFHSPAAPSKAIAAPVQKPKVVVASTAPTGPKANTATRTDAAEARKSPPSVQPATPLQPQRQISATAHIPAPDPTLLYSQPAAPRPAGPVSHLPAYVRMGFHHIVPEGIDHILFVLGLFLLSTRWKDLLKQISAFTLAHSITLALSLYGVVRLPSAVVEPIIALSIVFVAVENVCTSQLKAWRIYVVFLFGLVHGLGFAGALQDAGLQRADFLTALVGFNVGVELGQLTVVAAAFALVGWLRSSVRYRRVVVVPASCAIAAVAVFWTIQRIWT